MRFGDELQDLLDSSYLDGARKLGAFSDQHQLRKKIDPRNALVVVFAPEDQESKELVVEVADTPPKRSRGLMHRTSVQPYQGMLFRFHYLGRQRMWMKNTPLSLDMIFIDSGRKEVVGVVHQTKPYSLDESGVDEVSDHVLEVPAGTARRLKIKKGTKVSFRKWLPVEGGSRKEAGDEVHKHRSFFGVPVHIDRPKGFQKTIYPPGHSPKRVVYRQDYGFVPDIIDHDGEELDVFVGSSRSRKLPVYVLEKVKRDDTSKFDENKVFLGFRGLKEVMRTAHRHMGDTAKRVRTIPFGEFKAQMDAGRLTSGWGNIEKISQVVERPAPASEASGSTSASRHVPLPGVDLLPAGTPAPVSQVGPYALYPTATVSVGEAIRARGLPDAISSSFSGSAALAELRRLYPELRTIGGGRSTDPSIPDPGTQYRTRSGHPLPLAARSPYAGPRVGEDPTGPFVTEMGEDYLHRPDRQEFLPLVLGHERAHGTPQGRRLISSIPADPSGVGTHGQDSEAFADYYGTLDAVGRAGADPSALSSWARGPGVGSIQPVQVTEEDVALARAADTAHPLDVERNLLIDRALGHAEIAGPAGAMARILYDPGYPGRLMRDHMPVPAAPPPEPPVQVEPLVPTGEVAKEGSAALLGEKKAAEFAPGIPSKTRFEPIPEVSGAPAKWDRVIQKHDAARAGSHFDLRLGDPATGHSHSWAIKKMPAPGKATYAPFQPTHQIEYHGFEGTIPAGTYGAGEVKTEQRSMVEVTKASDNEVRFVIPEGRIPEQFVLKRQPTGGGKMWTLHNITPTRAVSKWDTLIPIGKPPMKSKLPSAVDTSDPGTVLQPKIDGAHVVAVLEGGKPLRLFSHRQARNETGLIEHTYRDPEYWKRLAPEGLKPTVVRGELWASDKSGKPVPLQDLSGILNSSIPEARKRLSEQGLKLRVSVHGVDRMDGKKVDSLPFDKVDQFLKNLVDQVPGLEHIQTARTPAQKKALLDKILKGKHPLTSEGVVEYRTGSPDGMKVKAYDPHDVYVREVYEGTRPGEAGGFRYSHTPTGKIVGAVGTGLTRTQRKEMLESPEKWLGRVAKVKAQEKLRSGALRAPVFEDLHLEKGLQPYHELG